MNYLDLDKPPPNQIQVINSHDIELVPMTAPLVNKEHSHSSSSSSSSHSSKSSKMKVDDFQNTNLQLTKIKMWHLIYAMVISVFTFIIALIASSSVSAHNSSMQDFKKNWMSYPLIDIQTALGKCPTGYKELITNYWPGTKHGCDWRYSWNWKYYGIYTTSCDFNQTIAGCKDVYPTKAITLSKFYSYKICGLESDENYVNMPMPDKKFGSSEVKWPSGYRVWGNGKADYMTWMKPNFPWPINDIYITSSNSIPFGYSYQPLDDGQVLVFSSNSTTLPTVRFKLTEGDVCANPSEIERSEGRVNYKLLNDYTQSKCSTKIGDTYTNPRFMLIGNVREDRLFEDNGVMNVIKNLPDYPVSDSSVYFWNLYTNNYNFWDLNCEKYGYTKDRMISVITLSGKVSDLQTSLIIICLIHMIICGFIINGISLHYTVQEKNGSSEGWVEPQNRFMFESITFAIKVILLIIKTVYFYRWLSINSDYEETMLTISSAQCTDEFGTQEFNEYESSSMNMFGFILTTLTVISSTAMILITFYYKTHS